MTKSQLKKRINDCMKEDKKHIQRLIDKAIESGCMDIQGAEDNYLLAKYVITAVYKEMSRQFSPLDHDKRGKKEVQNIYTHI